jgi:hypothetical protein
MKNKLKTKIHVDISVADKSFQVPIEIDTYDIISYISSSSDAVKKAVLDEIMGNTDRTKVAKWVKSIDRKYFIFASLRTDDDARKEKARKQK